MNPTIRIFLVLKIICTSFLSGEVRTPAIIGNNMVLQQKQENKIWGWADPGEYISVSLSSQNLKTTADSTGKWMVKLAPMNASFEPMTLKINQLSYENILIGEVWLCSGQSNMAWSVGNSDDSDLEVMTANYPSIRLISIPQVGTQEPQLDFIGQWEPVTPRTVINFSAVGYLFGRKIHQAMNVPVGLIDNAWGGSACEAWIPRKRLEQLKVARPFMNSWLEIEANYDPVAVQERYERQKTNWQKEVKKAKESGEPRPRAPKPPRNPLTGQHLPANLFHGVLNPIIGYGIRGAIWYQGETNSPRGHAYREVFPLMIQSWRDAWKQGDFSFYWAQLADFGKELIEPASQQWPELREAQTFTLDKLKNVGEAVIIDSGEGRDIHPRNKQIVANRLVRHALAKDYGINIPHQSPRFREMETREERIVLFFDHVGEGLYTFDVQEPLGFSICGKDRKFVWADAKLIGKDKVEVWSDSIEKPIAVRYAWADNPVCNLYRKDGKITLPATPFRTDDFPPVTLGR